MLGGIYLDPEVTVLIVYYSHSDDLSRCLESLAQTRYTNFNVIIVSNGSVDRLENVISSHKTDFPLRIIRNQHNLGYPGGCNIGLKHVTSKYVVLLNQDTQVTPDWLSFLVATAESDPQIAAAQPKLLHLGDGNAFDYNGAAGGFLDLQAIPFLRGRVFESTENDLGQYDRTTDVFWASGASMFLRTHALREVGPLDETFFMHMDEIDLSWRLRLRGYRIVCDPSSVVFHKGGSDLDSYYYLKQRNNLILLLKNYGLKNAATAFLGRSVLDTASMLYYMRKNGNRSISTLRAYLWVLFNLRQVFNRRAIVQSCRTVPDDRIVASMAKTSVALQYFLMRRRLFLRLSGLPAPIASYIR